MAVKKSGLGRGLDSLIPDKKSTVNTEIKEKKKSADKSTAGKTSARKTGKAEKVEKTNHAVNQEVEENISVYVENIEESGERRGEILLKINEVEPNRSQPRKEFDEDALLELADSIKQFGVLQPLLVQKKDGYYEIIAGERRWRAAKIAGIKEIPVLIKEYTDQEVVEISLIENIQRENLNAIEEANAYKRLLEEFHLKQDEVAERVSKSRTAVTNSMRLLKLNARVQQMVIDDMISTGHARALLAIEDEEQQYIIANKIFDEKLSVRETERLVKSLKAPKKESKTVKNEHLFVYDDIVEKMKNIIGTKVNIRTKANGKGKIEIEYYSEEELERIYDMIMTIQK